MKKSHLLYSAKAFQDVLKYAATRRYVMETKDAYYMPAYSEVIATLQNHAKEAGLDKEIKRLDTEEWEALKAKDAPQD